MSKLSHLNEKGDAHMVDISAKAVTAREATAEATITLSQEAFAAVMDGTAPKGDVLAAARIAGIMAAKKVPELIPLCHPIAISKVEIAFEPDAANHAIRILAMVATSGQTGVEMEALTAAALAALTLYDMIKAVDKAAVIGDVRLLAKSGGKSGAYKAPANTRPSAPSRAKRAGGGGGPQPSGPTAVAGPRASEGRGGQISRPKPEVLMGEVAAPRASADARRDAFRDFMTSHRLRPTSWAKDAGIHSGEILGYLTGRSKGFSRDVAEKLARAAKVRVEDMFG